MDARLIERCLIVGDLVVDAPERRLEATELQGCNLVAGGDLDRVELVTPGRAGRHRGSAQSGAKSGTTSPRVS